MSEEQLHPMVRKARREFEESLEDGRPVRWIMINRAKVHTVQEAVRVLEKYCKMYPDIAERMDAETKIQSELVYERQTALSLKKTEAVRTLCEWYNRPKIQMVYRYQAIRAEAEKIPGEILRLEKDEFIRMKSARPEPVILHDEGERAENVSIDDYPSLAISNLQKRIDGLLEEETALGTELSEECGKLKTLSEKITETKNKMRAIEETHSMLAGRETI